MNRASPMSSASVRAAAKGLNNRKPPTSDHRDAEDGQDRPADTTALGGALRSTSWTRQQS